MSAAGRANGADGCVSGVGAWAGEGGGCGAVGAAAVAPLLRVCYWTFPCL